MILIGLTGSIGMGKSTTAKLFRRLGVPTHDADAAVHHLMTRGGKAVKAVDAAFPGSVVDGAVDRKTLGNRVFGDPDALKWLERIVHPLVHEETSRFLAKHRRACRPFVVLDVPLLLEGNGHRRCDVIVVVSAPRFLQRQRVLARPGMTVERLASILEKQMPDREKRRFADAVVPTGLGQAWAMRRLERLIKDLRRYGVKSCVKSSSIRRRQVLIRRRATRWSRSAA